jgi:hypothetical protein
MVTEEEAKKRWCPFARVVRSSTGAMTSVNRDGPHPDPRALCIASECMAWRAVADPNSGGVVRGYCGLSGPPQSSSGANQ